MLSQEFDQQQLLAQLPPDVLPTMHMVSQLPGMGERTYGPREENVRYWFGKTNMHGRPVVLGVNARRDTTQFLIWEENQFETWELEEQFCNEAKFVRKSAGSKSSLVPDGGMDRPKESSMYPRFVATIDFCSHSSGGTEPCGTCVFKDGQNQDLLAESGRKGSIAYWSEEPTAFPLRRETDVTRPDVWLSKRSFNDGFTDQEQVLAALRAIREGILQAEMVSVEDAVRLIPGEILRVNERFRYLAPIEE